MRGTLDMEGDISPLRHWDGARHDCLGNVHSLTSRSGLPYHARADVYAVLDGYARARANVLSGGAGSNGQPVPDLHATTGIGPGCLDRNGAADGHVAPGPMRGGEG
jgi:hypothetical protein